MKFVDRFEETERLNKVLSGNKPSFAVVYGRRRLGKSTLLKRVLAENDVYYVTYGIARRWWGPVSRTEKIELDIVAQSLDKKYLLVGECKWTSGENCERLAFELKEKAEKLSFARNKSIVPVLFLKHPAICNNAAVLLPEDVIELTCRL